MTYVVRCLDSVKLDPMTPALARLISVLEQAAQRLKRDLVVTCGREGHDATDPHTRGMALDVRTRDVADGPLLALLDFLRTALGPAWTVLYEVPTRPTGVRGQGAWVNPKASAEHCHIQPLKGTVWPM